MDSISIMRKVSRRTSQTMTPDMSLKDWKTLVNRSYGNVSLPAIFSDLMVDAEQLCEDFYEAAPTMKPKDIANIMNPANKINNMYIVGNKYLCFRDKDQPHVYYNLTYKGLDQHDIEAAILFLGMLMITDRKSAREIKTWAMTNYVASSSVLGHYEAEFDTPTATTYYSIVSLLPDVEA